VLAAVSQVKPRVTSMVHIHHWKPILNNSKYPSSPIFFLFFIQKDCSQQERKKTPTTTSINLSSEYLNSQIEQDGKEITQEDLRSLD
jgi:hypothetical protein